MVRFQNRILTRQCSKSIYTILSAIVIVRLPSSRRILFITLIVISVVSSVAIAQERAEIAGQIEISDEVEGPQKLAWDGDSIWYSNINTGTIYQVDPTSGEIVQSIETGLDSPSGIEVTND